MNIILPGNWHIGRLDQYTERIIDYRGKSPNKVEDGVPLITAKNIKKGNLEFDECCEYIPEIEYKDWMTRGLPCSGDLLFTTEAPLGNVALFPNHGRYALAQRVVCIQCDKNKMLNKYLMYYLLSHIGSKEVNIRATGSTALGIKQSILRTVPVIAPTIPEQEKIAEVLGCWDSGIDRLEKLIDSKRKMKKALMQQLLTGKKRFKEFVKSREMCKYHFYELPMDWRNVKVSDIAKEITKRHDGSDVIVLSCSKYDGLVNSLDYFGKKVYSDDTSNYKIVKCGQFAYPSNHIEEGSIGLLRHIENGIVSPIYTVFQTNEMVDPEFMYAVFKTDLYKHIFSVNTNASVDRRGSLRWREFSNIHVPLPSLDEQKKIASVLNVADREIELLCHKLETLKNQKQGLMQKLLTGKVRVKV